MKAKKGDEVVHTREFANALRRGPLPVPEYGIVREVRNSEYALVQWVGNPYEVIVRQNLIQLRFND